MNIFRTIKLEVGGYRGIAIAGAEREVSYPELWEMVDSWMNRLRQIGIGSDARVGVRLENSADYVALSLAILAIDAVIVPISRQASMQETLTIIENINVNFLLTTLPCKKWEAEAEFPFAEGCRMRVYRFEEHPVTPLELDDGRKSAFIRFSSGTTGASKGVILSHQAVLERTAASGKLHIGEGEPVLWVLDMAFHFVVTILLFLRRRAMIVMVSPPLEQGMFDALCRYPVKLLYATPYHYRIMIESAAFTPALLTTVTQAISTAQNLMPDTAIAFREKFTHPLVQAYGIIEVGLPCINDSMEGKRAGSVGRLQPAYQLKLDRERGGIGEICLRGPGMFDAYFTPFATRHSIAPDGWFHTGDLGLLDQDGYLFIVGRAKNVINFLGIKIFPYEVEAALNRMPEIRESLVWGRPTPGYGEIPAAKLVLAKGVAWNNELKKHIRQYCFSQLSPEKVPKEFVPVDSLAKTVSGKLIREKCE